MLSKEDYSEMITRLVLRDASFNSLMDLEYFIRKYMEEGDYKNSIRDLLHKVEKASYEIDDLLYKRPGPWIWTRPGQEDLEKFFILTNKHWDAILELYKAIGQKEFEYQMAYFQECKHDPWYRKKAKEELDRFLNGRCG